MTKEKNNLYYVCSLIEFTGRMTKNRNKELVKMIGVDELERQLSVADLNHCLTFEQVSSELIEDFNILPGEFDSVLNCKYIVPNEIAIGSVYADLILDIKKNSSKTSAQIMYEVFTSFISDEISNFNNAVYYENSSYIYHSYLAGKLLE